MKHLKIFLITIFVIITLSLTVISQVRTAEGPAKAAINRDRGLSILKDVKSHLKNRYYDKQLRGIDIDAKYKEAKARIEKLDKNWQIFRVIAQFVMQFDDSHTRFYPPGRANRVEYGFKVQMIGQVCYVVDVTKGSDAEAKGLKVGDILAGIDRYNPNRDNLWRINYILYQLDPLQKLSVYVLDSNKKERKIEIEATFKSIKQRRKEAFAKRKKQKKNGAYKCYEASADLIACRLETFAINKSFIKQMMKEIAGHKNLILDLRGNGGGYVYIEEYLVGHFFDRDIKIADFKTRNKTKERIAKSQKENVFNGELIVLIDSESASAAEVFARVIQLEKRGKVIGDISAGAVMTSVFVQGVFARGEAALKSYSVFGLNVTIADLIMSDGQRLENVGVVPDVAIGPSGNALANKTDPILAYAIKEFGGKMTEQEAGKLHFLVPKQEGDDEEVEEAQ